MRQMCWIPWLGVWIVCLGARGASPDGAKPDVAFPGTVRLLLPEVIHAVAGIETNVYFDNVTLVLNAANYAFDVTCAKGVQQTERWTYTPSDKDTGAYPLTVEMRDQANTVIARARSTIRVVPADVGAGVSISALLIGDSLTHASVYSAHLLDLFRRPDNPALTLIGTHAPNDRPNENRHEGYGGWTCRRFATHFTGIARTGDYRKRGSPFLYKGANGKPKLDFTRYCREVHHGEPPDFVTFFLGCNDVFSATDETIESRIDEMFRDLDTLIAMVRRTDDKTHIGLICPVPPAGTQDAFGTNYRCGQTRWQYKRNQHRVIERMIEQYAGQEEQRISLVPAYINLDCLHGFPTRKAPRNARTTLSVKRLSNGVHPSAEGYRQIGDSIYCWMKAQLAGE